MWFCWEHPILSQVYCCFSVSPSKYHKVGLLPDPFSLQHPRTCLQAPGLGPFQEHPHGPCFLWRHCAGDLQGTGPRPCLFIKESKAIPAAGHCCTKAEKCSCTHFEISKNKAGFVSHHSERPWLPSVDTASFSKAWTERYLCLWVYWRDYCNVTWYLASRRLGSVTQKALPVSPGVFLFF